MGDNGLTMRSKYSKLRTKEEVRAVYTALNRLDKLAKSYKTIDEVRFAIMLMKTQLKETEQIIEINEIRKRIEYEENWIQSYMKCRFAPCHTCPLLWIDCYSPTPEQVKEIEERWEKQNSTK